MRRICLALLLSPAAAGQVLFNFDFEAGVNGHFMNWSGYPTSAPVSMDNTVAHTGVQSLKVSILAMSYNFGSNGLVVRQTIAFSTFAGKHLHLTLTSKPAESLPATRACICTI